MGIRDIIKEKKEWRRKYQDYDNRIKNLPEDYQIVYKEIEKYYHRVGLADLTEEMEILSGILEIFEEGASENKDVLEVTGSDVASFCDDLIKDSKTFTEVIQEAINQEYRKELSKTENRKK